MEIHCHNKNSKYNQISSKNMTIDEIRWLIWDEIESLTDKELKKILYISERINIIEIFLNIKNKRTLEKFCLILDEMNSIFTDFFVNNNRRRNRNRKVERKTNRFVTWNEIDNKEVD